MFLAFTTKPDCRHPAFRLERTVTFATVCCAGLEPAADHHVGATIDPTFPFATAVFATETLAFRAGGAARHRARLLFSTSVFEAMLRSMSWTAGAAIKLACSICTVLGAHATCYYKSGASLHLAHFCAATAMPTAPSFCYRFGSCCAIAERAEPIGAVLLAEVTSFNSYTTPSS